MRIVERMQASPRGKRKKKKFIGCEAKEKQERAEECAEGQQYRLRWEQRAATDTQTPAHSGTQRRRVCWAGLGQRVLS